MCSEHLPNPEAAVAEIERVLVMGGVLVVQVPFVYPLHDAPFDFQRWTRYGLTRLLAVNGFELLSEDSFGHPIETAALLGNIALARTVVNLSVFAESTGGSSRRGGIVADPVEQHSRLALFPASRERRDHAFWLSVCLSKRGGETCPVDRRVTSR